MTVFNLTATAHALLVKMAAEDGTNVSSFVKKLITDEAARRSMPGSSVEERLTALEDQVELLVNQAAA